MIDGRGAFIGAWLACSTIPGALAGALVAWYLLHSRRSRRP